MAYINVLAVGWSMMITTSPSELVLADDCGRAHDFKYTQRLRLKQEKRGGTLASGTVVHAVIETWCQDLGGTVPAKADLEMRALPLLEDEFRNDWDGPTKNVKKFFPGVVRALGRVPTWVWEEKAWNVERDVDGFFGQECTTDWLHVINHGRGWSSNCELGPAVYLHGRPDMWREVNDEAPTIQILDTKTTDYDPLDFLLWTPQNRWYAAMLAQEFPGRLIEYRYMCLPTAVKDVAAPHSPPWLLTKAGAERAEEEILTYVSKLGGTDPRYSRRCSWCDFSKICQAIITGADPAGITEELYEVRERHG